MNTNKLKAAIVGAGYTQSELAQKIGISKNTLSDKVNGKKRMFLDEALKLCTLLDIQSDYEKVQIFLPSASQNGDESVQIHKM